MGGYGDLKTKKFLNAVKWLENHKPIAVKKGGRHNIKVTCIHNAHSFVLPTSHPEVNKHIVKKFVDWLVINDLCSREEFDQHL